MVDQDSKITILDAEHSVEELRCIDRNGLKAASRRLVGGLRDGVLMTALSNGALSIDLIPTRGLGISEVRCGDIRLGWDSPIRGPVHPKWVRLTEPSGLGWLDGFDEWFVRCGLLSNGTPQFGDLGQLVYPLHGRIANQPAHKVDVCIDPDKSEMLLTGLVDETRFHFQKLRLTSSIRLRANETSFQIHDQVTNLSGSPATVQMLYHINFGPPVLRPGAELVAPARRIVPRNSHSAAAISVWNQYGDPTPSFPEEVFFLELAADADGQTLVLLKSADAAMGVGLRFNVAHLPCFTQWKNTTAYEDGYVTGLEPGTNFPNPRNFEEQHGRVIELAPGATTDFFIDVIVATNAEVIQQLTDEITQLQGGQTPTVHEGPLADWCAP